MKRHSFSVVIYFALKPSLLDINIITSVFFLLMLELNIFFYHFIFNLFRCLYLKWVSHRQHVVASCFFIQSGNLWILIGVLRPFTFNVIITIDELKPTILLFVFYMSSVFSGPFSSFPIFLLDYLHIWEV